MEEIKPVEEKKTEMVRPQNNLAWAIVVTALCCPPFGVPAIVNAARVDPLWRDGKYEMAQAAARNCKKWIIVSAITGCVFWFLYFIYIIFFVFLVATL